MSDSLQPHGRYPPGSFVHGISQARILEWVAISYSRESSWHRDWNCISRLLLWQADSLPLEPPGKPNVFTHDSKWQRVRDTPCFVGLIEVPPFPFQRLGPPGRSYDNSGLMMLMVIITIIHVHKQGQSFKAFSWGKRMMGYFQEKFPVSRIISRLYLSGP